MMTNSILRDIDINYIKKLQGSFPDPVTAVEDTPFCYGGNLSKNMLLAAYGLGIFPMFSASTPIYWWNIAPRCVLPPQSYHLPRRAARSIRKAGFTITLDRAFEDVIGMCGKLREEEANAWLIKPMILAYINLYKAGFAHSLEAWQDGSLVGGLYGVALGRAFFGESMFHTVSEASRACLCALTALLRARGMTLLDCQTRTNHIMAQGGVMLSRSDFTRELKDALEFRRDSCDELSEEYRLVPNAEKFWPYLPWVYRFNFKQETGTWERGEAYLKS